MVHLEGEGVVGEAAGEDVHREVKRGVVVLNGANEAQVAEVAAELLANLAAKRLLGRLARLDLATLKLPAACMLSRRASPGENTAVVCNGCPNNPHVPPAFRGSASFYRYDSLRSCAAGVP